MTLTGTNFGPADGTVTVSAKYGNSKVGYYTATGCTVKTAHTKITCKSVAGIGANLTWIVTVASQTSAASSAMNRYKTPVITGISGSGKTNAVTSGGQSLTITGTNFGPTTSSLTPNVTYGKTGKSYTATSCTVTATDTQITCLTGTGTGSKLKTIVEIGYQYSAAYQGNMSYGAPVVQYYVTQWSSSFGANTQGGQYVLIYGSNFGTIAQNALEKVTYGSNGTEYVPCASSTTCSCTIVTDHTKINCTTVRGSGATQKWIVTINGQQSTSPTTSYAAPTITKLSGAGAINGSTSGGQNVTITGTEFGYMNSKLQSVKYGPSGSEWTAKSCSIVTPHTKIVCLTSAGLGGTNYWVVTVDSQSSQSSTVTTGYSKPVISKLSAYTGSAGGGTKITITGSNFGAGVTNAYASVRRHSDMQRVWRQPSRLVCSQCCRTSR